VRPNAARRIVVITASLVLAIVMLVLIAIGVSAATLPGCGLCHKDAHFVSETQKGSHAGIPCKSCHGGSTLGSRLHFGSEEVLGMALRLHRVDYTLRAVDDVMCVKCHADVLKNPTNAKGLRIVHSSCAKTSQCTDCHSTVAHGKASSWPRTATMSQCYECHGSSKIDSKCNTCHAGKLPTQRIRTSTFAVTHGPNYLKTHGMGDMNTCGACHPSTTCAKCHGTGLPHPNGFVNTHGKVALAPGAKCTMCHRKSFCITCHGYPMPHPKTFIKQHSSIVKRDGKAGCLKCHVQEDCDTCHIDHVHPTTLDQLRSLGVIKGGSK